MVVKPAPTAPKERLKTDQQLKQVWSDQPFVRPPRTPWGRFVLLVVAIGLVTSGMILVALGAIIQRYPDSWLANWWPAGTTTTVIRNSSAAPVTAPSTVRGFADQIGMLAVAKEAGSVYTAGDGLLSVVPLSSNGWYVGLKRDLPADTPLVIVPPTGQPQVVQTTVDDLGTPFRFFNIASSSTTSAKVLTPRAAVADPNVWVIQSQPRQPRLLPARIVGLDQDTWQSSDQLNWWYQLATTVAWPVGSPVIDRSGQVVGLLGDDQRVWPTAVIDPVLKPLLQQHVIERPQLGLRTLDRQLAIVDGDPTASGWLVGGTDASPAVTDGSPAAGAAIQAGDVITQVDGQTPTGDPFSWLLAHHPGDSLTLTVLRDGQTRSVTVQLGGL